MSTTPKISVCMAMYNAAPYLRECVDSILTQTFTDFELLIVDDGSTDDSVDIVRSYADPRIRLICLKSSVKDTMVTIDHVEETSEGLLKGGFAIIGGEDENSPFDLNFGDCYCTNNCEQGCKPTSKKSSNGVIDPSTLSF